MKACIKSGPLVIVLSLLFATLLLIASGPHGLGGFPLDDAWIHMVYGRSVSTSGYLAYNAGIPATGSTSPLWAYLLGLIHVVFKKTSVIVLVVKMTGMAMHSLAAWACYRILKKFQLPSIVSMIGGVILGFSPALVAASISGMEIPLGCSLCLLGFERLMEKKHMTAGLLFGLSGLARPEYGLVIVVLMGGMGLQILKKKMPGKDLILFACPVAIAGFLFIGWNVFVAGRPFPATFYVKSRYYAHFPFLDRILIALKMITSDAPLAGGVAWLGLLGPAVSKEPARRWFYLFLISALSYAAGQITIMPPADPQAFYHIRYLLPVIPLFWIPLVAGVWALVTYFRDQVSGARGKIMAGGVVVIFLSATAFFLIFGTISWRAKFANDCRNIDEVQVELGQAIDNTLPAGARIGTVDAGAIKYFGRHYTVDLMGLNTPDVLQGRTPSLDALVLMPAWVQWPLDHGLEEVGRRSTLDYWVTSNPAMNTQIVMACRAGVKNSEISLRISRRKVNVLMKGMSDAQIKELENLLKDH
jgi:hypothetical protein